MKLFHEEVASADPDTTKGWVRRMLPIMRAHWRTTLLALGAAAANMVLRIQVPQVTMRAIDRALITRVDPLARYFWVLAAMAAVLLLLGFVFRYFLQRAAFEIDYDLRVLLFQQFQRLSFSFYDRAQTGQLVSRANSDVRAVQMFLTFAPMMLVTSVTFFAALYLMVQIHIPLTVVALATSPFVFVVGGWMRNSMFPISWLQAARQAELATVVEENVSGSRIVKSFAAEKSEIGKLERVAQRLRWVSVEQAYNRARFGPILQNLPRLSMSLLLLYGGWLVIDDQITIGALFAFNAYVFMLQMPFMMLGFVLMMAQRAAASSHRIFALLDQEPEIQDRPGAVDLVDCEGDVELHDVTFAYGAGRSEQSERRGRERYADGPEILDGFSLHLRRGETVALVGRTGCGKSTVARLIPRFYDVTSGAVLVDGRDIRDYTIPSLRGHIGLVLDENFLFSDTLYNNITFGRPDADPADVEAAVRAAGAADFIEAMPDGYDTAVGERGYTLSGGQRQRLAIARTLLVNPQILILDDATSSIDAHREQEIHGALRALMTGRTTLIIAHRVSTISLAERVVLMDGGRVVAEGTHEELLRTVPLYVAVLAQAELDEAEHEAEPDEVGASRRLAPTNGDGFDRMGMPFGDPTSFGGGA